MKSIRSQHDGKLTKIVNASGEDGEEIDNLCKL